MQAPEATAKVEPWIYDQVMRLVGAITGLTPQLAGWYQAVFAKTLLACLDGKLSPATLVMRLKHAPHEAAVLKQLAVVCACFHAAADVADDCEDDDLRPEIWAPEDRPQAINLASGLLFIVYQAIAKLDITEDRRQLIFAEFTRAGLAMHVGQHLDLASTNRPNPADYAAIARQKCGAEVGAFFAVAAIALGRPPEAYRQLGEAAGYLIQAASDVADVWLESDSADLSAGKQGLPIALALATGDAEIRRALAGDRRLPRRQQSLRRALCQTAVLQGWAQTADQLAGELQSQLARIPEETGLAQLVTDLSHDARNLADALTAAAPEMRRQRARATGPLVVPAIDQAMHYLKSSDPLVQESWDVQRWGLFGKPEVVGDVFGPAVVGEVLAEVGIPQMALRSHLLARQDQDGWRYFPGHPDIPCDIDCLGYVLTLLQRTQPAAEPLWPEVATAVDAAHRTCILDGRLSVYMYRSNADVTSAEWPGNDCAGSIASGLYSLTALQRPEWRAILANTVADLCDAEENGQWASFYYPEPAVCTMLVTRALMAQRPQLTGPLATRVDQALGRVHDRLVRTQRLDGGWGSPQRTAAALASLLLLDPGAAEVQYAVSYLQDTQSYDGSWAAEDYFRTVGPDNTVGAFRSKAVTTALCLRALHRAAHALVAHSPSMRVEQSLVSGGSERR